MLNKKFIISIIYRIVIFCVLIACLRLQNGLVRIIFGIIGIGAFVFGVVGNRLKYKWRLYVLIAYAIIFVAISVYYNVNFLDDMLLMRTTTNQHMYQLEDKDNKTFCEAYLRELIRNKKVVVPYSVKVLYDYVPIENEEERGAGFKPNYYWDNNYTRYFQEYAALCETDDTLPKRLEVPEFIEGKTEMFTDYGITNDLLRYTFLLNQEHAKETKYFWYSWYYNSFAEEENRYPHLYLIPEDCEGADTLIAIWDRDENLYIMSAGKYAEVKG